MQKVKIQAKATVVYKNLQEAYNMTTEDGKNFDVYAIWKLDTPLTVTYRANGGELKKVDDSSSTDSQSGSDTTPSTDDTQGGNDAQGGNDSTPSTDDTQSGDDTAQATDAPADQVCKNSRYSGY